MAVSAGDGGASMEVLASAYRSALETGCLCGVRLGGLLVSFVDNARKAAQGQEQGELETQLLVQVSFLQAAVNSVLEDGEKRRRRHCRTMLKLVRTLLQTKFALVSLLRRVSDGGGGGGGGGGCSTRLGCACRVLVVTLLRKGPCWNDDDCNRSCHKVMRDLIRGVSSSKTVAVLSAMLGEDGDEKRKGEKFILLTPNEKKGDNVGFCPRPCPVTEGSGMDSGWHDRAVRQSAVVAMRPEWKRWSSSPALRSDGSFLSLWRRVVSVHSDFAGFAASRESVASTVNVVRDVVDGAPAAVAVKDEDDRESVLWQKKADVLNEALCYGSTLALQGEISQEICDICQCLLKDLLVTGAFDSPLSIATDMSPSGERGVRSVSLLAFKCAAILLRQATVCSSSGEDSDNSHSSRGCLAAEEAEEIESRMLQLLNKWHLWARASPSESFVACFLRLFLEQDDLLLEAMLCLIDAHAAVSVLAGPAAPSSSAAAAPVPSVDFDPLEVFSRFMDNLGWDVSVVIDFLISNETCFLLYFLRLLKYAKKKLFDCSTSSAARPPPPPWRLLDSPELESFFAECLASLNKLNSKNLFPYNIAPVTSLLEKVVSIR